MSLAERAKTPPQIKGPGLPCPIALLLTEKLNPAEAKGLQAMLDAPWRVWPHISIEKALGEEGHNVAWNSVGKHRRGGCRCAKQP